VSQAGPLAALEGRKLVRHPIFLAGLGLAFVGSASFVGAAVRLPAVSWDQHGWTVFVGGVLLGLLTLVGTNHAALRDRREHTVEQHDALPVGKGTRTAGLLLATSWPTATGAALLAAVVGYAAIVSHVGTVDLVHLAALIVDVVMFGTLGIAIARWLPSSLVAPLVAFGFILSAPSEHASSWQVLSPLAHVGSVDLAIWHLAYIAGLSAIWCAAALLKGDLRRVSISIGIGGLAVTAVSIGVLLPRVCAGAGSCLF
jgi:hypothetical protein